MTSQGADADNFNPDRFINESGEVLFPLTDLKDGMLFTRLYSIIFDLLTLSIEGQEDILFTFTSLELCSHWLVNFQGMLPM